MDPISTVTLRYALITPNIRCLERAQLATGVAAVLFVWLLTSPIDRVHAGAW